MDAARDRDAFEDNWPPLPNLTSYVAASLNCTSGEQLSELTGRVIAPLGFERFICANYLPMKVEPRPEPRYLGTLPEMWRREYSARGYWAQDVILRKITSSDSPVHWGSAAAEATREERQVFERANLHGLVDGVSVGIAKPSGVRSFVSFVSRQPLTPSPIEMALLRHVAVALDMRWREILTIKGEQQNTLRAAVSDRERACLLLLREGKTNPQIARVLGITPRTVQFHLGNVAEKLGATGRTDIIARALALGVVDPFG